MSHYNMKIEYINNHYIYKKVYGSESLIQKKIHYQNLNLNILQSNEPTYYCGLLIAMEENLKKCFRIINIKQPTIYGTEIMLQTINNIHDFYYAIKIINIYIKKINKRNNTKFLLYKIQYDK